MFDKKHISKIFGLKLKDFNFKYNRDKEHELYEKKLKIYLNKLSKKIRGSSSGCV